MVAGYIGWNALDVLGRPTPAARVVNALLTRLCVTFVIVMVRHTPDPGDPNEALFAWFNAAVDEHKHDVAAMIKGLGDVDWGLPASPRWAARRMTAGQRRQLPDGKEASDYRPGDVTGCCSWMTMDGGGADPIL